MGGGTTDSAGLDKYVKAMEEMMMASDSTKRHNSRGRGIREEQTGKVPDHVTAIPPPPPPPPGAPRVCR